MVARGAESVEEGQSNPIQVLAKASAILDALAESGELTATELAELLGEPRSSIYRLLSSLTEIGLVEAGKDRGTVRLGVKLFSLGSSAVRSRDVRAAAMPRMAELREKNGHTVFLAIRRGFEALCIERLEGLTTVNNALLPGTTGHLHVGAVGRILLAAEPPTFWGEYVASVGLPTYTESTISTQAELERALTEVNASGFSVSDEDRLPGMAGVGAPIRDHEGQVRAAISFSGPRPLVLGENGDQSTATITETAAAISADLGYAGAPVPS